MGLDSYGALASNQLIPLTLSISGTSSQLMIPVSLRTTCGRCRREIVASTVTDLQNHACTCSQPRQGTILDRETQDIHPIPVPTRNPGHFHPISVQEI